ncbi:hypothetical protein BP6252_06771 [Coleophoma cylindrospora]|uniref:Uncharacterized protein n=1 Tax=Coleophoma cylindrospora TaxID=1849047 RepID=A0A3D8RG68_9HELO|nr:hypothetical protein BP6252_06771 [Coleophoma cylindrospora]
MEWEMVEVDIRLMQSSGSAALTYSIFESNVRDLKVWLAEKRLSESWKPDNTEAASHTILRAYTASLAIEFNINKKLQLRLQDNLSGKTTIVPNGV